MQELLVPEPACGAPSRLPGVWWRAAQVQEVTGHTVQRAIWRNVRSLF